MHLVQGFSKVLIPLWKNCCSWSFSQPFVAQITFLSSETLCLFINSFSLGKKQRSLGARTTHLITMSAQALAAIQNAGFEPLHHPLYSPFVFVLQLIARQMAGFKTKNNNSSITESELWRMLDQVHFSCRRIR